MYREEDDKIVIYFAYTKKAFRKNGLIKGLLRVLNPLKKAVKISYTGRIPGYIMQKQIDFEKGSV